MDTIGIAAEEMGSEGPTGCYVEVLEAALMDQGDNEYARATTPRAIRETTAPRGLSTRWIPVRTGRTISVREADAAEVRL